MSSHFETGVFTRGLGAWHKLGNVVEEGHPAEKDARLAMQLGGLDWTVSMRQAYIALEGPHNLLLGTIAGVRAIVRDSDNRILGNAGDVPCAEAKARASYVPYQWHQMADWVQPLLDSGMATVEATASLYGGQRVYMQVKIGHNGDSHAEVVPGDMVRNNWLIANSHNGKHSLRVARCRTRVVCANTLAAAFGEGCNVRLRHSGGLVEVLHDLRAVMVREQEAFAKDVDLFRTLAGKQINKKVIREYIEAVFPESFKEKKETAAEKRERERLEARAAARAQYGKVATPDIRAGKSLVDELLGNGSGPGVVGAMQEAARNDFADQRAELCSDILDRVSELVETGRGTNIPGVRGTMWGLYNATNEYLQYEYGRGPKGMTDKRMDAMVFGAPATWNALALQKAQSFGRG